MKLSLTKAQLQWIFFVVVLIVVIFLVVSGKPFNRQDFLSNSDTENGLPCATQKWKWVVQQAESIKGHLVA